MISCVCVQGNKVDKDLAGRLARQFNVPVVNELPVRSLYNSTNHIDSTLDGEDGADDEDNLQINRPAYFLLDKTGLSFIIDGQELKGDFTRLLPRISGGHLQHEILLKVAKQPAGKAKSSDRAKSDCSVIAGFKPDSPSGLTLRAVDATAGLGEDSFILAAGGYEVELFEHNPITAALLNDALIRARKDPKLRDIAKRMKLTVGDSKELLGKLSYKPDIIYLDPMFPEKKKSAESKKKLQVLHHIELPCSDEDELLAAAMHAGPKKIIIKRPPEGEYLGGVKPTYSVERKAVRFDCIYEKSEAL